MCSICSSPASGSKFESKAKEGIIIKLLEHGTLRPLLCDKVKGYNVADSCQVTFDDSRIPSLSHSEPFIDGKPQNDDKFDVSDDRIPGGSDDEVSVMVERQAGT